MILNGIMFFLSLTASFFLFFFNVPYWTGQDMADMSKSGIWRAPFRFLSRIGFGCFKLYKIVVKKISDACLSRLRGHREIEKDVWSGIEGLLDVSCSAGVLFLLISGYNCFMDGLFPAGVDILAEGNDGSLLGKLSEAVVFLRVAADLKAGDADGTILTAAMRTAIAMAQYVAINTLFFSILFGFLQELLVKKPFWDLVANKLDICSVAEPEEGASPLRRLLGQIKEAAIDFFNKTTVHISLGDTVSLTLFLLGLLIYSFVMTWLGKNDLGLLDVVQQVLEAIGVVQIVASFLVTYLVGKLCEKAANAVVEVLPQGLQDAIRSASDRGNEWVKREDASRHTWAQGNRSGIKEMDLEGSDK